MLGLMELLRLAKEKNASDIFIVSGQPLSYKSEGAIVTVDDEKVMPPTAEALIKEAYAIGHRDMSHFENTGDDDFALSVPDLSRLRVSAYQQRGSMAAVIRMIAFGVPDYRQFGIPEAVMELSKATKGLILVTGPAGNGKSTTLATLIDAGWAEQLPTGRFVVTPRLVGLLKAYNLALSAAQERIDSFQARSDALARQFLPRNNF